MESTSLKSIGIQINQIYFDSVHRCTVWGKVFIEQGFYHCDIEMSVYQLTTLLEHHGSLGRLIHQMIKNDYQNQMRQYPNLVDLEENLGNGVVLLADELVLSKILARRRHEDGTVHYALRIDEVRKINKLQMLRNTSKVARLTSIPNDRIVPDIESLKVAYKKFKYYTSINILEAHARSKSGLDNPYLFKMAEYFHCA